jgi:hypothetical protein
LKKLTPKIWLTVLLLTATTYIQCQTLISAGITSDATWTTTGSPYTITTDILVSPGVTITIQPGVVIQFNAGKKLQLDQSRIIANGSASAPIIFTSSSSSVPGAWNRIEMTGPPITSVFRHCEFRYAQTALYDNRLSAADSIIIHNCSFHHNTNGINFFATTYGYIDSSSFTNNTVGLAMMRTTTMKYCDISNNQTGIESSSFDTIIHCTISNNVLGMLAIACCQHIKDCRIYKNQTGLSAAHRHLKIENTLVDSNTVAGIYFTGNRDSIVRCSIRYNGIGIKDFNGDGVWSNLITENQIEYNSTGIQLSCITEEINCNKICNNTTYALDYNFSANVNVTNNYWCTTDSSSIASMIYDGNENASYGFVDFMPLDTGCYLFSTGITNQVKENHPFRIFPNPSNGIVFIELMAEKAEGTIRVYDVLGKLKTVFTLSGKNISLDLSFLEKGIYFIELDAGKTVGRQKFLKE